MTAFGVALRPEVRLSSALLSPSDAQGLERMRDDKLITRQTRCKRLF
jgi:hypothetical protein